MTKLGKRHEKIIIPPPWVLKFHFGAHHRWNPIWTPSPNPSWGPQLPQLSTSPSKMGKPPPRLLETGFLAIFLCSPFHLSSPPSLPVLYLFRWLCFRSRRRNGKKKKRCNGEWGGNGGRWWGLAGFFFFKVRTLPHSSPLKIGHPKRKVLFQPPIFRFYVSFREGIFFYSFTTSLVPNRGLHHWHHIPCWPPGFRRVLGWSRCVGLVVGQIALVCGITLKHNRYLASVGVLVDVWTVFFDKKRGC